MPVTSASFALFTSLFTVIPAAAGVGFIGYGIYRVLRVASLVRSGQRVAGTVVDNQMRSRARGRIGFRPVVRFRTVAGEELTVVINQERGRSTVVGSTVEVAYDETAPHNAELTSGNGMTSASYVLAGIAFIIFALVVNSARG
jgi:hypothetical protein